ncbi:MAG: response regulator [Gemmatimonadetes bacterium]|nr:response regulator [Gemmatimonadota bacterium]
MSADDAQLLATIEVAMVFCLSGVLLLFSGGEARRVLRYWAAAGLGFCVREWSASRLAIDLSGLLWDRAGMALLSQFAEHVVLIAIVAGAYELRGGARITRTALGVFLVVGALGALALVSLPGMTMGDAVAWRGVIAVGCAAVMCAAVFLLRGELVIESRVGRRVLLVTVALLALERLAAGYLRLAVPRQWPAPDWFVLLPILELLLIVVGLVATVVVLLEREQAEARRQREDAGRAERELHARDAWFGQLIDSASDIITVLDETATIRFESPAVTRVLGYGTRDNVGASALRLVHPEDQAGVSLVLEGVLSGRVAVGQAKFRYKAKDGSWRVLESEGRELTWEGSERRFVVTTRDVTERELLEQRLVHAGKMESIGRLAGGVAHDFNNLLTVIMSNAALAQVNGMAKAAVGRELEEIAGASARAARLTSQLLAFSRRQVVALQPVDLRSTLPPLLGMLRRLVGERVEIEADVAPDLPPVHADPGQVDQVITNLVINARDAMPDGGRVTLVASLRHLEAHPVPANEEVVPGRYVLVRVTDTGPGIPAAVRDHLFEPFFTTKDRGRGTGLGLATCYGIVRRHGGHIWHEDAAGGGASFVVCLPLSADPVPRARQIGAPSADAVRGSETILLVEDDAHVRATTERILAEFGYQVHTAEHGEDALRLLPGIPTPDLVVTDVVMPQMDGVALAERLRETMPDLPVVFVSGYNEHAEVMDRTVPGQTRHVSKPFTPLELLLAIRGLLDVRVSSAAH